MTGERSSPTFGELMEQSVIVQGILAIIAVGGVMFMVATQVPVAPEIWVIVGSIVGFFFGAKGVQSTQRIANNALANTTSLASDFANNMRIVMSENNQALVRVMQSPGATPAATALEVPNESAR